MSISCERAVSMMMPMRELVARMRRHTSKPSMSGSMMSSSATRISLVLLQHLQRLLAGACLDDLITGTAQIDDDKAADAGFILQNQNFFHKLLLLCR